MINTRHYRTFSLYTWFLFRLFRFFAFFFVLYWQTTRHPDQINQTLFNIMLQTFQRR